MEKEKKKNEEKELKVQIDLGEEMGWGETEEGWVVPECHHVSAGQRGDMASCDLDLSMLLRAGEMA